MKRLFMKKGLFALIYIVLALVTEVISFAVMDIGFFPDYWGIDVAFILGLAVIIFIIPSPVASICVASVILLLQIVLACVNEALMTMSGMVFSLTMLNLAKEVGGVFSGDFVNWWLLVGLALLFAAGLTGMIVLQKKFPTPKTRFSKQAIIALLLCCLLGENAAMICYQFTLNSFNKVVVSDELSLYDDDDYLYNSQFIPAKALRKFGAYGFYFMNVSNTIDSLLGAFDDGASMPQKQGLSMLDEYFKTGQMSEEAYGENPYTGALSGKNIVLIVIESGEWYAINREYTPTLYSMAKEGISFTEYYARDKTNHSEALSILGSYPVLSAPATDLKRSTLSFTLPNMLRSAGYTTNYFHANKGEFYERNVTHGANGNYGFDTAHFPENMPEMKGYKNPDKKFSDYDKDLTIAKYYADEYTYQKEEDRAFFTMHMTLSSHGDYNDLLDHGDYTKSLSESEKKARSKEYDVKDFEKYYEVIDGYPKTYISADKGVPEDYLSQFSKDKQQTLYLRYKRFQAGMMDLDETIATLVEHLKQTGELDDTAFMFYADHTAYYNSQNYFMKGVSTDQPLTSSLYNIPCFIWYGGSMDLNSTPAGDFYSGYKPTTFTATKDSESALQTGRIDKFCNTFDIVPTLLQLVGYDYNLNLYHGVSMFSDLESAFVSRESGIFRNDIYFDGTTVSVKTFSGEWVQYDYETTRAENGFPQEVKEFLEASARYYDKQEKIEAMYELDYFAHRPMEKQYDGIVYARQVKTQENS